MKFHENLIALRRREGWSQEELGNRIGVTRQTVSKWELGLTTPELEKLVQLADVFGMTTDQLVGRTAATVPQEPVARPDPVVYEYISPRRLWGLPLVHIKLGRGRCRAKGILAIGNVATGILSIGMVSCGVVALGSVSLGVLALGAVAVGLCGALGGAAMGFFAMGGIAPGDCVLWRSGGGCIRDGRLRRRCAGCSWRNCKRTGCHWAYCFRRTDAAPSRSWCSVSDPRNYFTKVSGHLGASPLVIFLGGV